MNAPPLDGIHVVDLSQFAPGLLASTLLADLGADVISVEAPGSGGPDLPLYANNAARAAGGHPFYRNRRSLVVDLRADDGVAILHRMIADADVVLEGFRPGVAERLSIGFEKACELNPTIVYCSITGYGQTGPGALRPGHDINYAAEGGALALAADGVHPPQAPQNLLADLAGGSLPAAFAVSAALYAVARGASAQFIDISMAHGVLALVAPAAALQRAGSPDPSWGKGFLTGAAPFYGSYRTADGGFVAVGAIEPKFFARLCEVLDRVDLIDQQFDVARWPAIRKEFESIFAAQDRDHWERLLPDAAVTAVLSAEEAFARAAADPATLQLIPALSMPGNRGYAHLPGEHTAEILGELGYASDEVESLAARRVVRGPM
jgi:alpha-methylacyl-CoA racemase